MKILVIALLKESQIKYKIKPLSLSKEVDEIYLVRKKQGPKIDKVNYIVLPKLCRYTFFYLSLTPIIIIYHLLHKKIDLILSYHFVPHGFFAFLSSFFTRIPFIYSQIDMDIQNYTKNKILRFFILKILKKAILINVPGTNSKEFWIQIGINANKIISIHSTIDTKNEFFPKNIEKIYDFIYVGVFDENKRPLVILQAFEELVNSGHDIKLCMIGFGEKEVDLISFIKEKNLENNVDIVHTNNVLNFYHKSNIFIMTSLMEGLPCALMEAMACELIALVPPVGNISDLVHHKQNGFIHNNSKEDLVLNMKYAYLNYTELFETQSSARKIIEEKHSFNSAIKSWNKVLTELNL